MQSAAERVLIDEWLFLVYIVLAAILRPAVAFREFRIPAADFFFPLLGLAWLAMIVTRRRTMVFTRFHLLAGAYVAILLASALASDMPRRSLVKWAGECYLVGIAVIGFSILTTESSFRRSAKAWVIAAALNVAAAAAATIAFYAGRPALAKRLGAAGSGTLPTGHYARVYGLFLFHNMACVFFIAAFAMTWLAFDQQWISRRAAVPLLIGIAISDFLTLSPALAGVILAAAIVIYLAERHAGRIARARWVLACGIVAAILDFGSALPSPEALVLRHTWEPSARIQIWSQAVPAVLAHPLLGRGVGLEVVHVDYRRPDGRVSHLTDAHNFLLSVAAQDGLIALGILIALIVFLLRGIPWLDRTSASRITVFLAIAFICGFLYPDLTGSFEDTRHVWVVIGMLAAAKELHGQSFLRTTADAWDASTISWVRRSKFS